MHPVTIRSLFGLAILPAFTHISVSAPTTPYSHGNPTDAEQYMLELVNRERANPTAGAARYNIDLNEGLAPGTISSDPKQPLAMNARLLEAARGHSQWMLDTDTFSHTGAAGSNPGDRMMGAGYSFTGSWTWGENIGWSGTTGNLQLIPTVAGIEEGLFVDEGIQGRGHRVNLETDAFREVGIGVREGVFTVGGVGYNAGMISQDFAKSDALGPFIVGVVFRDADADGFYTPGEGIAGVTVMPAAGTYYAVTSGSGGFAIPVGSVSGNLQVQISGGSLADKFTKTVTLAGRNVKLDFNTAADQPDIPEIRLVNPGFTSTGSFKFEIAGPADLQVSVESSENMFRWDPRQTITLGPGSSFTDNNASRIGKRYYRVKKL